MYSRYTKKKFSMLLVLGLILSGCGDSDDGHQATSQTPASKLTESDFDLIGTELSSSSLIDMINSEESFMSENNNDTTSNEMACVTQKIGSYTFKREIDNTFTLNIPSVDLRGCYNITGLTVHKYLYSIYLTKIMVQDEFGNPVDLEGLGFTDVDNYTLVQGLSRGYFELDYEILILDEEVVAVKYTSMSALNSAENWNEPCAVTPVFSNCVQRLASHTQQSNDIEYIFALALTANNLGIEPGGTYYTNGTMDFEINNWSGVMTYGADSSVAPTYVATDGIEEITGTYSPPLQTSVQALSVPDPETILKPMLKVFR